MIYYYNLYSTEYAFFKKSFEQVVWPPPESSEPSRTTDIDETVITYYNQTPLYLDRACTVPTTAQVSYEWTEHTINGTVQSFVDVMAVFVSEGNQCEASLVAAVNVFEVGLPYTYNVFESAGTLERAQSVSILRGMDNIVQLTINLPLVRVIVENRIISRMENQSFLQFDAIIQINELAIEDNELLVPSSPVRLWTQLSSDSNTTTQSKQSPFVRYEDDFWSSQSLRFQTPLSATTKLQIGFRKVNYPIIPQYRFTEIPLNSDTPPVTIIVL